MRTARLDRLLQRLHRLEDRVLALLLAGMVILAAAQILTRNLFGTGLGWGEPLLRLLVLWLALMGAMAATRDRRHIRIDALLHFLPPRLSTWATRFTDLFSAIICGLVAWHGGRLVLVEWADGGILFAGIPTWVGQVIIPFGFGLMAVRFALQALAPPRSDNP